MQSVEFRLYLITDRLQTNGRNLAGVVREALAGGVMAVQLREKGLASRELFSLAAELRKITADHGAKLFINDRIDVALAVDADGVHLGTGTLPVTAARELLGAHRLIGYSAHGVAEACRAEADGADFVTFGPVYFTPSKAAYGVPLGVKELKAACAALTIPLFALGGIRLESIAEVIAAGSHGIALISAIIAAPDPQTAATSLLQTIERHAHHP